MLKLLFCGADETVTGSMHHFTYQNTHMDKPFTFCVDAGFFQTGEELEELELNKKLYFDPKELDALVVTHAHLDHVGKIPYLVAKGFNGPIYSTPITQRIAGIVMEDAAKQQFNKFTRSLQDEDPTNDLTIDTVLYSGQDAIKAQKLFITKEYRQKFRIHENLEVEFFDAGHIFGSAWVKIKEVDTGKYIVCSGDLGSINKPFINPFEKERAEDGLQAILIETTYGNKLHTEKNPRKNLTDIINNTYDKDGITLIPCFAVERSQEIIFILLKAMKEGKMPKMTIYLDSPMAQKVTEVFEQNREHYNREVKDFEKHIGRSVFKDSQVKIMETMQDSKNLNFLHEPAIIIAGAGMMNGGKILKHLRFHAHDKNNSLVMVGYQSEGTIGRMIQDGIRKLLLDGVGVDLNLNIYSLNGFSGHADKDMLQDWLFSQLTNKSLKSGKVKVVLVHGEKEAQEYFKNEVRVKSGGMLNIMQGKIGEEVVIFE